MANRYSLVLLVLTLEAEGHVLKAAIEGWRNVTTHPLQIAFAEDRALRLEYCTPAMN